MPTWGWLLAAYLVVINIATFAFFVYDKSIAGRSAWRRIPEATLHTFALFGGTPAALLAMNVLRHKSAKRGFWFCVMIILVFQIGVVVAWAIWRQ